MTDERYIYCVSSCSELSSPRLSSLFGIQSSAAMESVTPPLHHQATRGLCIVSGGLRSDSLGFVSHTVNNGTELEQILTFKR